MASPSSPRSSCSGVTKDGDDDDEESGSIRFTEYNDTGNNSGNESSGSHCYRVCQNCKRPNPNCDDLLVCCCKDCFRTGGVECSAECDVDYLYTRYLRLPTHKSLMLLRIPSQICPLRLCKKIRLSQDLEFSFRAWQQSPRKFEREATHIMRLMNVGRQVLGVDLEFAHHPSIVWNREGNPHRKEICFRSWRLTFRKSSEERRKIQQKRVLKLLEVGFKRWRLSRSICEGWCRRSICESDCPSLCIVALSQFEWLRGGLGLYRDPYNERYWICKAKTCDGCVVRWLYLDTLVHISGRSTDQIQLESNAGASFEWLRGEIELYKDPTSESLWICPAQSSEGSGYPWLHVATLLQMGKHTDRGQ